MPGRVLIVDDVVPNVKLLSAKLQSEYYDVLAADDGYTAIEIARRESPDLILLDVMMPGIDGFTVCERLKADPLTAHIPVIMVTALSDSADRVRGLQAGADDFLSKPVRDLPLFARVRSLIRLKLLMDVWRVREETSNRLGLKGLTPAAGTDAPLKGRILVIEDSELEADALAQALSEENYEMSIARTAEAGLSEVVSGDFDLVLIALHFAGADSLRLCSQIRSHVNESVRSLPILLMAEDEQDITQIAKGLDLGVNDYVIKPIDRQELQARVRTQIRRRHFHNSLRSNYERSIAMASTDPLTGVYNRRYLDAHLEQLVRRSIDSHKPLSVAFCDIDHFKRLNDTYGHAVGDEVLVEFCNRLRSNTRSMDLVARMGGEEFVVIMPDTPPERALRIAERLRARVDGNPFMVSAAEPIPVTISVGLATLALTDANGLALLKRADEAMYRAKRGGRNRVVVAEELDD